jgi:hypothetical protein
VFVVAGMLDGENDWEHYFSPKPTIKLLGAAGIREISERGMEVGAHTACTDSCGTSFPVG